MTADLNAEDVKNRLFNTLKSRGVLDSLKVRSLLLVSVCDEDVNALLLFISQYFLAGILKQIKYCFISVRFVL